VTALAFMPSRNELLGLETWSEMDRISERAAQRGIETEYQDGLGCRRVVEPQVLARLLDIMAAKGEPERRMLPWTVVIRRGRDRRQRLDAPDGCEIRWNISTAETTVAGEGQSSSIVLPEDLPIGVFPLRLTATSPEGERSEDATLLVAPERAYQGRDDAPRRSWALAVQLYGVRSRRNWGHGDFTDLAGLIDLAAELGAAGIGLNPLHAVFDDRADEASPYSPNSRLFLNPLYVDVEAIPEFPGLAAAGLKREVEALRDRELIDYGRVAEVKMQAFALAYAVFRGQGNERRQREFERFRRQRGPELARFASFELLRRRLGLPWWDWPAQWRRPDEETLDQLRASDGDAVAYREFVQWIADQQLGACRDKARRLGLPIGLYLDIAVGVRPDGFDAWSGQDFILPTAEIGAPPDPLNTQGQRWGLAGVDPVGLAKRECEPFRGLLRASMRYAGAVRLDHVMGLQRLYLIPNGMRGDQGAYIGFPFEALLAVVSQESVANRCIVIGEDLGTVPENFRETIADWGIWSYQVMLFERARDGGFVAPEHYRENALVTFATHDLPTFAGWTSHHDLVVKRALGLDPGETDDDRTAARAALGRALAARGLPRLDFSSVTTFLAATPSRILVVTLEDALGVAEQVNVPGTIAEHPNWRRRLPVFLEDLKRERGLISVQNVMASAGRRVAAVAW
jgi:4-alpha-glucanotransferase